MGRLGRPLVQVGALIGKLECTVSLVIRDLLIRSLLDSTLLGHFGTIAFFLGAVGLLV